MEQKKVSIIVPVFNAEAYLTRSIRSVLEQTYSNWELLIVDDGSGDRSREICSHYAQEDKRIRLFCNQHGGTARARNTALDVASGDYIAFLDADDAFHPQYLECMIEATESTSSDISLCKTVKGTEADSFFASTVMPSFTIITREESLKRMYGGDWPDLIAPYTKVYARRIFSDLRFPDGRYFEDAATMNLAIYRSNQIVDVNAVLYFYNITPNSSSKTKRACELMDREAALRSHWEFYEQENRADLVKLAVPFYLQELITIYHKILKSDDPEKSKAVRFRFEEIYGKHKKSIVFSEEQSDRILAFRYPRLYDIRNQIREEGLLRTTVYHLKRIAQKLEH